MLKKTDNKAKDNSHPTESSEELLKKQIEDLTYKWKRALADYQNLEKRSSESIKESSRYASERVITKILSALDNLESAERHLKDQGLTLALKNLHDALTSEGVTKIEVLGKSFDPLTMEAVEIVEGDKDNIAVEEIRPGYKLEDKILRVARVKVSKKKQIKEG